MFLITRIKSVGKPQGSVKRAAQYRVTSTKNKQRVEECSVRMYMY